MVNWRRGPWYICILPYVKPIWCSGITQIHGQLEEGAFVYVYSAISETYLVQWYSIDIWSIGRGYICPGYMCILLYVKIIQCTGITQIYGQLQVGALVYVHSAISETYIMLHYSIDLWSIGGYICPGYMYILLHVKHICCSDIPYIYGQLEEGTLVYLHSTICETYLVQQYYIDLWSIVGGGLGICAFCYI